MGDMDQVRKYSHDDDAHDALDANGNNALMIACTYGQTEMAAHLLKSPDNSRNDQNSTPLICAIRQGNSLDTVRVLLQDANIKASVNTVFDLAGNTAALYACGTNNIDLLKALVDEGGAQLDQAKNSTTQDSALHIAARNDASLPFLLYVLEQMNDTMAMHRRSSLGETVYHVCKQVDFIKYVLDQVPSAKRVIVRSYDHKLGRSPIMVWASKGRLDLVELLISDLSVEDCARVDSQGNTLLHLLATNLTKGLIFGEKSIYLIIKKLRSVVHVREWNHGNTALHFAAETSTLASTQNINNAILFIRALVKYGATLDAVNYRDEHPVNISRIPELTACLDGKYV
jgi:ankyrin repeat protein